jgi:hypothetical protein
MTGLLECGPLLFMVMPEGLTGLELAEKPDLKAIISRGDIPGSTGNGQRIAEGIAYLRKSHDGLVLQRTVRKCLHRK